MTKLNAKAHFSSENTLKEHQEFLTKTEISLISDKSFTMESLWEFQILNGAASTGDFTKVILAIKIVY